MLKMNTIHNQYIEKFKKAKKCKIKVSPLKSLIHETINVLEKYCLRSPKKRCIFHCNSGPTNTNTCTFHLYFEQFTIIIYI